jgi:hypothetical protein
VFLVLALGIFLIGGVGFVVDGANLWFHRQSAQTAADAACTAGTMDMLSVAAGADISGTPWTSSADSYAGLNGYQSGALTISFPTTFAGIPSSSNCVQPNPVCAADQVVSATPLYMQVNVNDPVPTTFMRLVGAGSSVTVPARSTCGLSNVLSAVPVVVLNPNVADAMTGSGTLLVSFSTSAPKNPPKLLQVNSTDSDAVSDFSGTIKLHNADDSTGTFAIAGQSKPAADGTYTPTNAAGIISDPFALIAAPAQPAPAPDPQYKVSSPECPPGITCDIYSPGHWGGLTIAGHQNGANNPSGLAVFEPGIYYLDGDFTAGQDTCLRPSYTTGNGGVVFYFHSGTLQINSQSGQLSRRGGAWTCQSEPVPASVLACPSSSGSNLPSGGISGNVLLGPCEAPSTDPLHAYGDPLGQADPLGEQRGMLFLQDRDTSSAQPFWTPTGSFGLIGNVYFHNCHDSGSADSGANCESDAFTDTLKLGGGTSSSPGLIFGDVVVDQLSINSGSNISVSLNPNPQYYVLKASLLQ